MPSMLVGKWEDFLIRSLPGIGAASSSNGTGGLCSNNIENIQT
jgi:hypothetical protein